MEHRRYIVYKVVLFTMLNGIVPFKSANLEQLSSLIINGDYSFCENISVAAKSLIQKILQTDSAKRIYIKKIIINPWFKG